VTIVRWVSERRDEWHSTKKKGNRPGVPFWIALSADEPKIEDLTCDGRMCAPAFATSLRFDELSAAVTYQHPKYEAVTRLLGDRTPAM
jgi:hypothetical protein